MASKGVMLQHGLGVRKNESEYSHQIAVCGGSDIYIGFKSV